MKTETTPSIWLFLKEDGQVYVTREPVPQEPECKSKENDCCFNRRCEWLEYMDKANRIRSEAVKVDPSSLSLISAILNYLNSIAIGAFYEVRGYEVDFKYWDNHDKKGNTECIEWATLRPVVKEESWVDIYKTWWAVRYTEKNWLWWLNENYHVPKRKG